MADPVSHSQNILAGVHYGCVFYRAALGIWDLSVCSPRVAQELHRQGLETHYEQNHADSALQYYEKAIALQPDFAEAHYNLGVLREELQQLDQAAAEYQIVVQSDFNDLKLLTKLRAHNNLGQLYILQKQYRAAWTPLEQALSFVSTTDPAQFQDPLDPDATWDEILYEKVQYSQKFRVVTG